MPSSIAAARTAATSAVVILFAPVDAHEVRQGASGASL
jgi:hypothetical protein